MRIGHIDLSPRIAVAEEQLVILVEAPTAHGIEQHVLVGNPFLARRLAACKGISVGPMVRTTVSACCLLPDVDLIHAHDGKALNACVLLTLTRSMPFVLTYRRHRMPGNGPITRSKYRRAEGIVCPSEQISMAMSVYADDTPVDTICDACAVDKDAPADRLGAEKMAAEYLRVYRRTLDQRDVPAMLL